MILESSYFYLVAIPAVMLYGIAKGGFAGPLAIIGVPLMSLVVSPLQAAAIMLPILCLQDIIAIYSYREKFHYQSLQTLIPGAILGSIFEHIWNVFPKKCKTRILCKTQRIFIKVDGFG